MQITPKHWSHMNSEEFDHYVKSFKENWYRLNVQKYGKNSPEAELIKEMDMDLLKGAFWETES